MRILLTAPFFLTASCVTAPSLVNETLGAASHNYDFDLSCNSSDPAQMAVLTLRGRLQMKPVDDAYQLAAPLTVSLPFRSDSTETTSHFLTGDADKVDSGIDLEELAATSPALSLHLKPDGQGYINYGDIKNLPVTCTKSLASVSKFIRTPSCNAQGTKAQGWYIGGKLVAYDKTCAKKIMQCGVTAGQQGWVVTTQENRQLIKQGYCSNQTLRCEGSPSKIRGWYQGAQLLKEDKNCHFSSVECGNIGTRQEGWYAFEQKNPELHQANSCLSGKTKDSSLAKR